MGQEWGLWGWEGVGVGVVGLEGGWNGGCGTGKGVMGLESELWGWNGRYGAGRGAAMEAMGLTRAPWG